MASSRAFAKSSDPSGFFMELIPRQLLTLQNLQVADIETDDDVISFCLSKMAKPYRQSGKRRKKIKNSEGRKHSKKYYHEIITFILFKQKENKV